MTRLTSLLSLFFLPVLLTAQVLTTDLPFPNPDTELTLTFDATQGNAGLQDCNCDVYLHTGLITSASTGAGDWKFVQGEWGQDIPRLKMTPAGDNLYTYTLTIRDFYDVPASAEIEQMAFVLRNVDGSQAGRASDNGDIFLDVFDSSAQLLTRLSEPSEALLFAEAGQSLTISGFASKPSRIEIMENGALINSSEADETSYSHTFTASTEPGLYEVVFAATDEQGTTASSSFEYFITPEVTVADPPASAKRGLTANSDGSFTLLLDAPQKDNILLLTDANDWKPALDQVLRQSTDGDQFWITTDLQATNGWYRYQFLVDGELRIADPYSEMILDPDNDRFIPQELAVFYPPYPAGAEGFVTVRPQQGFQYEWQHTDYEAPATEDLFVYEILMRDFLEDHSYRSLIDTLDYLQRLGVNAIELMPVNEFEGNESWGYNPSFHMALDKYYGDPIAFKRLVDEAHGRGMAVLLDVVFNHAFSQSPLARLYWDAENFRPAADNPWLNVTARHPFNVGYDFNHESPYTQAFMDRSLQYWLDEYRIDGFRFDLSKGFSQTDYGSDVGAWSSYDADRVRLLKRMAGVIRADHPEAILILEHFGDLQEETELIEYDFLVWNNLNFNYSEASMGYNAGGNSNLSGAYHGNRGWEAPRLMTYMESHDEERMMYKNLQFGNSSGNYDVTDLNTALDRVKLSHTFFWTIPGPKMIWQFGELGYAFSINQCVGGGVRNACRLDPKPIRWDYQRSAAREAVYNHLADLTYLRREYRSTFNDDIPTLNVDAALKSIRLDGPDLNLLAVGNFDVVETTATLVFPTAGTWYNYFTGDSLQVDNTTISRSLPAGAYELWLDRPVERPFGSETITSTVDLQPGGRLQLYPNPARGGTEVWMDWEPQRSGTRSWLEIYNLQGQRQLRRTVGAGLQPLPVLSEGTHLIRLISAQGKLLAQRLLIVN